MFKAFSVLFSVFQFLVLRTFYSFLFSLEKKQSIKFSVSINSIEEMIPVSSFKNLSSFRSQLFIRPFRLSQCIQFLVLGTYYS